LLTTGIAVAAHEYYGVDMSEREAGLLAHSGSIWTALDKLARRLDLRDVGASSDTQSWLDEQRLMIAEAIADLHGVTDGTARTELVTELLEREMQFRIELDRPITKSAELQVAFGEYGGPSDLARFHNQARKLQNSQRARLEAEVSDGRVRAEALKKLERVYERYINDALRFAASYVTTPGATQTRRRGPG
jgi:hypothetical protein